ncbi:MptD family putative ECF transporter S component [Nocardia sp. NPDC049220]|uniref:MptD family putative ECF transporter S component n=1 Tax=Nocardia sp. NPDC049220 TaxID=3155273 RepID=UPI0033C6A4E4
MTLDRPPREPFFAGRRIDIRMSAQDLITIGVFAALYVVIVFAINMLGFLNPAIMLVALAAGIVAGGVPFMLFLTRVRHPGMVLLFAAITSGLMTLTGHPPIGLPLTLLCALFAESALWIGEYRSPRMSVLAYTAYSLWYCTPLLPIFYARDEYFADPAMQQMGSGYIEQMKDLLSPPVLAGFSASTVLFGLLGGLLGLRMLRKHFEKAGLA